MRVEEVNEETRPELFFLPRDTGEVDSEGNPIIVHDVTYEETAETTGRHIRRKGKEGKVRGIHVDTDVVRIYNADVLVASYVLQIGHRLISGGTWSTVTIPLGNFELANGVISASTVQPGYSAQVSVDTRTGDWAVHITAPGRLLRVRWMIQWPETADPDVRFGYDDYQGTVVDDSGSPIQTIDFEPDGIEEEITIGQIIPVRRDLKGGNDLRLRDTGVLVQHYKRGRSDTLTLSDSITTVP